MAGRLVIMKVVVGDYFPFLPKLQKKKNIYKIDLGKNFKKQTSQNIILLLFHLTFQ